MFVTVRACICVCASVSDVFKSQSNSMQHKRLGILCIIRGVARGWIGWTMSWGPEGPKGPKTKLTQKYHCFGGHLTVSLHGPPKVLFHLYIILYSSSGSKIVLGLF